MAETPVSASPPPPSQPDTEPLQYWCYHCEKRVSVETVTDVVVDIICFECKNGFVELISTSSTQQLSSSSATTTNSNNDFGNQFLQILRLIAEAARDDDNPPPPPPPPPVSTDLHPESGDFLRIELNGWNNDEDEEEEGIHFGINNDDIGIGVVRTENEIANEDEADDDEDDDEGEEDEEEVDPDEEPGEDDVRRRIRRDLLRLRIRDFASRATSGRNRILDWSEILMGLEDHTMEFRVEMPEWDGYVGNPEDYLDAAGYEALLQNLAESDGSRKGAPPASKSAVLGLKTVEIAAEEEALVCAICKEAVQVGEKAKKMPCGHGYHGDCIVTWLGSRNTCPICRFELPTEDPEYEEQRKKKSSAGSSAGGGSSNSGSNNRGS
ncbi:E3 ubiquitin-protein ligase ring1 [Thalictrum thalictroides]|uniref:RING-type E3 ubiquitin transferase n=1 Tax=Thalictrum thalictroides TaxID=46969 RepID=A0A7J6X1Y8_THATH|nr:E3 ubiquitin-protein ligase ring1 [Thalictrum thalictroides]